MRPSVILHSPTQHSGNRLFLSARNVQIAPVQLAAGHDRAVDLWALGILIYELICMRSPFADNGTMGSGLGGATKARCTTLATTFCGLGIFFRLGF